MSKIWTRRAYDLPTIESLAIAEQARPTDAKDEGAQGRYDPVMRSAMAPCLEDQGRGLSNSDGLRELISSIRFI